ncbi:M56 family metallopeptidase [Cohnella sp. AR92]|uniref:M56 family metallopeptidase n=1 Tax=Cohnella sp. AR92 TaxID=648716 RepID=UPI000F8C5363|nr:M56 family metallopeptidase [Cohnella sp. AR92]RUS47369.1 DUF4825 domain-containing protein [Cohnella sp. AR92]
MNGLVGTFTTVLNMSITASYAAAVVLIIRLLLRRAPRVYSYALWSVVLLRMVTPVTLVSGFSLLSLLNAGQSDSGRLEYIPQDIDMMKRPEIATGIRLIDRTVNSSLPGAILTHSANPLQIIMALACAVWISGVVILLLHGLLAYWRTANKIRTATLIGENVYETDQIASPFAFGLLRPKIYVPVGLSQSELRYITEHERAHIRRKDHWIKPIAYLALIVHWFNPLLWISYGRMSKDMEMACDESVLKSLGVDNRQGYSQSLLSLASGHSWARGGPLAFGENHVASRIKHIVRFRAPSPRGLALSFLVVLIAVAGLAVNPGAQAAEPLSAPRSPKMVEGYPIQELLRYKTPYVGAAGNVGNLIQRMPRPEGLTGGIMELHTVAPPYGATFHYKPEAGFTGVIQIEERNAVFFRNAAILFSLIGNVDTIHAYIEGAGGETYTVARSQVEEAFDGDVRKYADDESSLAAYIVQVQAYELKAP